jgi:hypothetical protein
MSRSQRRTVVLAVVVCAFACATPAHATFPGTNGKLLFSHAGSDCLSLINPDGTGETTTPLCFGFHGGFGRPRLSPTGTRVAYNDCDHLCDFGVLTVNLDGTDPQSGYYAALQDVSSQAWSPDATRIVEGAEDFDAEGNTYSDVSTVPATGGPPYPHQTVVSHSCPHPDSSCPIYTRLDWSPDGSKIAIATPVQVVNSSGGPETTLTDNFGSQPSWSPDGRKIAFQDLHDGKGEIYVMNADGSAKTNLTNAPGNADTDPFWSPDGSTIAFRRDGGVWTMNADGTNQVMVATGTLWDWQSIPVTAYPRPKGASPFQTYLVPAYERCTAPNRTHGSPLAFPSCSPPTQSSGQLTLGTPDSNGQPANSLASVFFATRVGDLKVAVAIRDVRKADLSDYTGQLDVQTDLRITDKNNTPSPGGPGAATVTDSPLHVPVSCTATGSATLGSDCNITTTVDSLYPGAITAGQRAVWQLGQVRAYDGGADGVASTTGDNTLFLTQGIFIP